MAAVRDLLGRADALAAVVTYQTAPAQWLTNAARVAATGHAVIVNCKGVAADSTPCIISLAELERLTRAAGEGGAQSCRPAGAQTDAAVKLSQAPENGILCGGDE